MRPWPKTRPFRQFVAFSVALIVLAGCTPPPNTGAPPRASTAAPANIWGGSGPPPGRTDAERAARKAYYRGSRADEF